MTEPAFGHTTIMSEPAISEPVPIAIQPMESTDFDIVHDITALWRRKVNVFAINAEQDRLTE